MPTLYLIDGHAQMFRAFFAIRSGMNSPVTGEPTNALFAFTGMLIKLFKNCDPDYAAIVFDATGPTFRDEIFTEYKANRDAPPDEFVQQIPRMFELAKLFGLPLYEKSGFEADDLMATIAAHTTGGKFDPPSHDLADLKTHLVAKDKDLEQTLSDRVVLCDIQEGTTLDADALMNKRGIRPDQVIDYQALIGDTADNIPGVSGIGPKTALTLLQKFETLDGVVANVQALKGKQKERIENAIEDGTLELSRTLVTLKTDVEFGFDLEACRMPGTEKIDHEGLIKLFKELGFNRHIVDLTELVKGKTPPRVEAKQTVDQASEHGFAGGLFDQPAEDGGLREEGETEETPMRTLGDYRAITTEAELDALLETLYGQPHFALDTETIGLGHQTEICGICIAWEVGSGVYIPTRSPDPGAHLSHETVMNKLRPILESQTPKKIGHNIKYDVLVLEAGGVRVRGVWFDTMIAAFLTHQPGLSMSALSLALLGHSDIPITELIGPKPRKKSDNPQLTMDRVPLDKITNYAAEDADVTLRLYEVLAPVLDEMGMTQLAADVEMPLVDVLATMEKNGIRVDPSVLDEQREVLQERADGLRTKILDEATPHLPDFNPDSPKQLAEVLFTHMNLPIQKRTKTGPSTDIEVLQKLADHADLTEAQKVLPGLIVEYRQLTKLINTYLKNLVDSISEKTGRIHASFNQTGAATGRLSSSNPNLQNIPIRTDLGRQIRRAFIAKPDHLLISADYSQIELRILAHLSEDPALLEAFNSGQDIHTAVAMQVFDLKAAEDVTPQYRTHAKTINFGIVYGVTAFGLARRIDNLDLKSAEKLIASYKTRFAGIDRFLQDCVAQAMNQGYVSTMLGRRRVIDAIHSSNPNTRSLGERLAINTVVQGSAADLIKVAMVNLHRRIEEEDLSMKMLLQIHDELVFESPEADAPTMAAIVTESMESAFTLKVPLKADAGIGTDWFDLK